MAKSTFTQEDDALLAELGVVVETKKQPAKTPKEERIIAGFEEIQRFVEAHGRAPEHGENNDIFERLYATRLEQIRTQEECRSVVEDVDYQGLLAGKGGIAEPSAEYESDEALLAALGVDTPKENDVTLLKHVKPRAEIRAAEDIGKRNYCEDFDTFKPIFESVQKDIESGRRKTLPFIKDGSIEKGNLFILSGQKAYVANIGDAFKGKDGRNEYRLRVIFDNGVESDQLMRSFQKRLWEDDSGRRITDISMGPLFDDVAEVVTENKVVAGNVAEDDDAASGTIYVLRSLSEHPIITDQRNIIHKIGVTGGDVKTRISKAKQDPTYLMADVEIVATYELYNINRTKLEKILHRFFGAARLDIEIPDRFGTKVKPKEWFLVPLFIVDEVVEKIKDGTIGRYEYDSKSATIALREVV
jgi:hypothetical protein